MDILNSGLLRSGQLRKHELIRELNQLHAFLPSINQEESARPPALDNIAAQLVDKSRLFNHDMEVRLLSCCCIVDILRIYAPEPPYDDVQLLHIFEAIISLFDSFGNYKSDSAVWMKIFYILKSLSIVRSGAVLVIMENKGTPVAVELVLSFLKCLFSIIKPEQHPDIISHAEVILQTCIEETETFEQSFIDILLLPLLPSAQIENITAYSVAQTLLTNTYNILRTPICNFVNEVLVGNNYRDSDLLEQ
jgi:sister-chromatid-cohesion protein PDS5